MQELIMQRMQQKLEKSCSRCEKNTWPVKSDYILQPPKYLIIVVNHFRYDMFDQFEMIDIHNSSIAYVVWYKLIT